MRLSSAVTLIAAGVVLLATETEARRKGSGNAVGSGSKSNSNNVDLGDFERGRRGKKKRGKGKKKVTPVKRFNYLFDKLQLFAGSHLKSNWKKMSNKMRRFKSVAVNNLGSQKNPRQVRCMQIEESEKFQRQARQKERKELLEQKRSLRIADQIKRRSNRLEGEDENLFEDDFVERRRRDDSYDSYDDSLTNQNSTEFDYDYYYYGEDSDYEVFIGEYENEFDLAYPDYEHEYEEGPGLGIQARGRRKKKKGGKGRKLGPIKIFFNINTALRTFINTELKSCARKNVFIRRLEKLQKNFKKNAPVLTKPPAKKGKKCKGRKCRKQKKG